MNVRTKAGIRQTALPFSSTRRKRQAAFTLREVLFCLVIVFVVAAVLFPVFESSRRKSKDYSCLSNEKQIGLGMIMYAQDYDERLPFARSLKNNREAWNFPGDTWENAVMPYVKSQEVFHCPQVPVVDEGRVNPSYRYNDLVVGANTGDAKTFTVLNKTILLMDGDSTIDDVGHAWTPDQTPQPAIINRRGLCEAGQGATVQDAPKRHTGYAHYVFADGHARGLPPNTVFFPPRASASRAHKDADGIAIGPDPAGTMAFAGTTYQATFQLR